MSDLTPEVKRLTPDVLSEDELYQLERREVLNKLDVDPAVGLTEESVQERQEIFGKNALEDSEKVPLWKKILEQFKDFMVLILIAAAIVSGALGEWKDAVLIIAIVIINAVLGVVQEGKAEKAIEALQKMSAPGARALRAGEQQVIAAADLVPGDIVLMEAGDVVPADIRLLESSNLKSDEASLTGESVPVEKDADFVADEKVTLGDRENMVYSGSALTYGRGTGVVVSIGEKTEVGKIAGRLKGIRQEMTPLQKNLNQLGKILGILCLAVCAVVFVVGLIQGGEVLPLFMTAVSLAVAAIPEGLPAVVTIVLALGMNRMAKKNAIVKRLLAVETLGSIDTICSDKTGTLTQNEMTVTRVFADDKLFEVSGTGYDPEGEIKAVDGDVTAGDSAVLKRLYTIAALCNEAELKLGEEGWTIIGDPTEGALLTLAEKAGHKRGDLLGNYQRLGDLPFDSDRKMMSVFHAGFDGEHEQLSLTKGAPDIVLGRCTHELTGNGVVELSDARRGEIEKKNSELASQALRVLAYAYKPYREGEEEHAEQDMIFVGLTGMIDPARPEAAAAIAKCHQAGIRAVMITGDYKETASAIAKDLGLSHDESEVLTGQELEEMSDKELQERCGRTSVYARVSPEHKVRIISALRETDHIASMTGDGVNDAPALKQADIGVAMGITGTDVAKGSADMILTDDNFATIVEAVEEGRVIYSNIRKFVGFLLSCNVGEILVVFLTTLLLGPQYAPLLPIQLLWLNLITDSFPALALGQEKGEPDIMLRPPRSKDEKIINKEMLLSILVQSVAIFVAIFAAFQIGRFFYPDELIVNDAVVQTASHYDFFAIPDFSPSAGARTYAFVTLIMAELLRAFSSRSEHYSVFQQGIFTNRTMNKAILLSFVLMLVVVFVPALDALFHTIAPNVRDWGIMLGLALIPFAFGEIFKLVYHRKGKKELARK